MSDRTAEPAFRAGDSQDHRQRGSVRHDTEDETSEPSDSKPIIQESDTEKLIIVKSDSDEEMQGEDVDEEMVMTSIVVNANDEEEAANKHDFVMAWVKTQRIECLHSTTVATQTPKAHSIFEYPWLRPRTDEAWRPWEDQYLIDSTLRGIPHEETASYFSERLVMRSKTDCCYRVTFHTHESDILPKSWTDRGGDIGLKDLGEDEWDELALFIWNGGGLEARIFRDERTAWGLRNCLREMDALDWDVLRFSVDRIMKKRAQRKREARRR